jgi:hypothetical protein
VIQKGPDLSRGPVLFLIVFCSLVDTRDRAAGGRIVVELPFDPPAGKDLEALWNELASDNGFAADRAVWALAAVPRQSVPFLCKRLRPAPEVEQRIARLISDLESNRFAVRQRAAEELDQLGRFAEAQLRQALKRRPGLDLTRRLERLLANRKPSARGMRALEVLAYVATPEARRAMMDIGIWDAADVEAASGRRSPGQGK